MQILKYQYTFFIQNLTMILSLIILLSQLLLFSSKQDLPNDFFCVVCHDICNSPVLKSEYLHENNIQCDDYIHKSNNQISCYFQLNIRFTCDLCGQLIQYLHSKNHLEQCSSLIQNGELINNQFLSSKQLGEQLLCKFCYQISYKPQKQNLEIVCLFCRQFHPEYTYIEIDGKLKEFYHKFEIQCKQCSQNILIDQLLIHFKRCHKNLIQLTKGGEIIEGKKKFRNKVKNNFKTVNLSINKLIRIFYDSCSSQFLISFQMNQVRKVQKKYNKFEQRLKNYKAIDLNLLN